MSSLQSEYDRLRNSPVQNPNEAEEIFHLFVGSQRFEGQKCAFKNLMEKKKYDIRPYVDTAHACYQKYQDDNCGETSRDNALDLCRSFNSEATCLAEYEINQRKGTLKTMVKFYYHRFESERYQALFKLKPEHLKFSCVKYGKTIMKIKVLAGTIEYSLMADLLKHVQDVWKNNNFEIEFEIVNNYAKDVITIVPINKAISFVKDNNPQVIYLSQSMDYQVTKKILAHEFGHVLGFPDCYIEFFDGTKKELVYYEISKQNMNIMCSMKDNVSVQDDYFRDLEENSCIF